MTPNTAERSLGSVIARIRRRIALRHQAKEDYRRARGTAQQQMLEESSILLQAQLKRAIETHREAEHAYKQAVLERDRELTEALVRYLVQTQLSQIPGIGPTLRAKIVRHVFRGRLSDLHSARRLEGIGSQRQYQISSWAHRVEAQLPRLLKEDFPGKSQILNVHREELDERRHQVVTIKQWVTKLQELQKQMDAALAGLTAVTWHDFHRALLESDDPPENIRRHMSGVFAAWEPMPDWFREALSLKEI